MPLNRHFDPNTDCLSTCFFGQTPEQLRKNITNDNELEDKTTLAFFVDGQSASAYDFIEDYNTKNPDQPISYVGALMERALEDDGIISFGTKRTEPYTKTLVSYCYDDDEGNLSKQGVTLRIRHEEYKDSKGRYRMKQPDISTKFLLEGDDTSSRAEFERTTDFVHDGDGNPKFHLTLLGIMEQQVEKTYHSQGAIRAMEWLQTFTKMMGHDFSNKREKTNINCKRTQPYAVMHTRYDHEGNLLRDEKTGKPLLFKPSESISPEDRLKGIKKANEIVFMFCLDVNRVFAPGTEEKITCDNEWEHEHQDHACAFMEGSIKSSDTVTREEIDAMDDYLKALKARVMRENNIGSSILSGMNKDARAYEYTKQRLGNVKPNTLTVRGKTDNFVVDNVSGFQDLLTQSPLIAKIYDEAIKEKNHTPRAVNH